jgi:hypothetical protein
MRTRLHASLPAIVLICWCAVSVGSLPAQQEKAAALKQSVAANQNLLRQYKWTETTIVKMKGEEKSRTQKLCFYGPDGKVQKQQLSASPPQQAPSGVKGKVVARKKEEISDYMQGAVALVHQYVPPDKQRIDSVVAAGALSVTPSSGGATMLTLKSYLKKGDEFGISIDTANNSIRTIAVKSYLQSEKDAITMSVTFVRQGDGLSYPANIVLNAPEKKIEVTVQNSNYQKASAQGAAPAPSAGGRAAPQGIDALTGPIALYPDALVAQILDASTNPAEVQDFGNWLKQNPNLKGSEVQEAASKAGFDAAFIALALFPDVIRMMAQKPDWTKQLGEAFKTDAQAVSNSIQRLRQQAQAMGNLKTNQQQEIVTQKASSGEQVIVIQPANPQVVYVPQYNPQVVYVQSAPPPSPSAAGAAMVGFTAGVIVGAAVHSNNYYYGPYAWHRPPVPAPYAYNAAALQNQRYNNAASLQQQRYNNASNLQNQQQANYQQNSSQRQSASQANQAQRQSASQANQTQRQNAASGAQSQATANQAQRQSAATSSRASGQAASQRGGMNSGGLSGYQNGSAARAESQRGNRSMASSRSGGRARRR